MKTPSKPPRNLVHKHSVEFNKPKTFRDRKKKAKTDGDYGDKPAHQPYKRKHRDYVLESLMEEDGYGD